MGDNTHNELSGSATNVVQAHTISGGVHFHDAAAKLPIPRQLPPDVPRFTDREASLARLDTWLDTPDERAAPAEVISGIGGVGKTSLATHWAHRVRDRSPDGDLYLDLRGYHTERSIGPDEALDQLLRALDLSGDRIPVGVGAKSALYRTLLHGRRMLVVLDNAATVEQTRPLLPGSPTCRVLVTSRNQLTGLSTRDGATRLPLDVLPPEHAGTLLERVAGADRTHADPAATAELARYCGYLPLALLIAAEYLVEHDELGVTDVVEELAEARTRLDVLSTEDDEFATVRAVFSWSYRALPPDAARLFRLLGLAPGPDIGLAAAAALADAPQARVRRLLDKLVGAHLLQSNGPNRYRFHDLLRIYAAECAEADEPELDRRAAIHRLLVWYANSVKAAGQVVAPHIFRIPVPLPQPSSTPVFADRLSALHWYDAEHPNVVAAVRQAAELGEHELAWQLPTVMFELFLARQNFAEWITTHELGLAAATSLGERQVEAWLHASISIALRDTRQYDRAMAHLDQALPAWQEVGIDWGVAWVLRETGLVHQLQGRNSTAVDLIQQSLAMNIARGDWWGEAVALNLLGLARHDLGQFDDALKDLNRSLDIYRERVDEPHVAGVLNNIGLVYGSQGRTDEAVTYLHQALAANQAADDWRGQALAHQRLGTVLHRAGRTETAEEHWRTALSLYEQLCDPRADDIRGLLER